MKYLNLIQELQELSVGLIKGTALVLRQSGQVLECQFLKHGLVCYQVQVSDELLKASLQAISVQGILEGLPYLAFRHDFSKFELHVKALKLYYELLTEQPGFTPDMQKLLVA